MRKYNPKIPGILSDTPLGYTVAWSLRTRGIIHHRAFLDITRWLGDWEQREEL